MKLADVDIDTPTNFDPSTIFPWIRASTIRDGQLSPHPCGVYPQNIPVDEFTRLSAIPYEQAEQLGYSKIDILHLGIYSIFTDRKQVEELLKVEPDWNMLLDPKIQEKLFQVAKHGDVLTKVKPKSIEQLADVLALIRPGRKQYINLYLAHPAETRRMLYARDESGYTFKKGHSIAYSMVIVLQLHLIKAGLL